MARMTSPAENPVFLCSKLCKIREPHIHHHQPEGPDTLEMWPEGSGKYAAAYHAEMAAMPMEDPSVCTACLQLGHACRAHVQKARSISFVNAEADLRKADSPVSPEVCSMLLCTERGVHGHGTDKVWAPRPVNVLDLRPGDWVRVWAQIVSPEDSGFAQSFHLHPDDVRVRMQSHESDLTVDVRREHVINKGDAPPWALQCTHLSTYQMDPSMIVRCESRLGPGHQHRWEHMSWTDSQSIGQIEVA